MGQHPRGTSRHRLFRLHEVPKLASVQTRLIPPDELCERTGWGVCQKIDIF